MQTDVRLIKTPGMAPDYDPVAKTLYGKPIKLIDFDTSAFEEYRTRVVIVRAMRTVESSDRVVSFAQVDSSLLTVGASKDGHAYFLDICWDCKWLAQAHKTDCRWVLVEEIHGL